MLTVYKASAGSGKTFNLVYEYVKVLLGVKQRDLPDSVYRLNSAKYCGSRQSGRHHGILAITFTNAATKEMKSRVVKALVSIAVPGNTHDYTAMLVKAFGCTPDELSMAAALALRELLYDYSNFHISTIDSFSQSVLRAFSRELNRQTDYDIELDVENSIRESVTDLLEEIKIPREESKEVSSLRKWIERYAAAKRESGAPYNFFNTSGGLLTGLTGNLRNALDETYNNYADSLDSYLENPDTINEFCRALKETEDPVTARLKKLASILLEMAKGYPDPDKLFSAYSRALAVMRNDDTINIDIAMIREADSCDDKKFVNQTFMKECHLTLADLAAPIAASRELCIELAHLYPRLKLIRTLASNAEVMEFFGHARRKQLDFLRENNTMLIADTNRLLKEIIDGAEAPFIYEKLGERIHTILIDEFQDTSQLQWDNLVPLVRNSLSEGFDNLIIGDVKQSIYRFRNTDSRLLGSIVESDPSLGKIKLRGKDVEDCTNRRSAWPVVLANNTIFHELPPRIDQSLCKGSDYAAKAYADVVQTPDARKENITAYVDIRFLDAGGDSDEAPVPPALVEDIRRQHDEGGYRWRDILVLVRTNNEGKTIVNYLKDNGIPVLSAESLLLNSSPAVRTVVSLMKLVRTYYNPGTVAIDMDNPSYSRDGITMLNTRFNYNVAQGVSPAEALHEALRHDISDDLRDAILEIRAMNPANTVALIDAIIKTQLNAGQRTAEFAYLAALQDIAIKYSDSADTSLGRFLNDYDANIDKWTIKPGADQDAVEVMTIHKSKGLERPCVHIPLCSWSMKPKDKSLWLDTQSLAQWLWGDDGESRRNLVPPIMWFGKVGSGSVLTSEASPFCDVLESEFMLDTLDTLNMTYVAFTRACRELIVHAQLPKQTKKGGSSKMPVSTFLFDTIKDCPDYSGSPNLISLSVCFDGNTKRFTLGAPTLKYFAGEEKENAEQKAAEETGQIIDLGEYAVSLDNANTRKLFSIDDAFALRAPDDEEKGTERIVTDAAAEGIHFHAIMERIRVADDLEQAVKRYCRIRGLDQSHFLEPLREAFVEPDNKNLIDSWFASENEIFSEMEIYDSADRRIHRPDRVVVCPDGSAIVVDYKFPSPGEDLEHSMATYRKQVSRYKFLLRRLGYEKVSGYIWYPRENRIVEV